MNNVFVIYIHGFDMCDHVVMKLARGTYEPERPPVEVDLRLALLPPGGKVVIGIMCILGNLCTLLKYIGDFKAYQIEISHVKKDHHPSSPPTYHSLRRSSCTLSRNCVKVGWISFFPEEDVRGAGG